MKNAETLYAILDAVLRENNTEQQGLAVALPGESAKSFAERYFGEGALLTGEFCNSDGSARYFYCYEDPLWIEHELEYRSAVINTPDGERIYIYSLD